MYNDKIGEQLGDARDATTYAIFLATTETAGRDLGKALVQIQTARAALDRAETNIRIRNAARRADA